MLELDNVKEISIVTEYVFEKYEPNYYTDILRVSRNWISYERKNFHTSKKMCSWSYKTTLLDFEHRFEELFYCIKDRYYSTTPIINVTDSGSYNIRVTLKDNSHVDMEGTGTLYNNNRENIAAAFRDLIPEHEVHPDLLDNKI